MQDRPIGTAGMPGGVPGSCTYCGECMPCLAGIDIAAVNQCLDIALPDENNIPPDTARRYRGLDRHGSDCAACGGCEDRCPLGVPNMRNMRRAARVFGV